MNRASRFCKISGHSSKTICPRHSQGPMTTWLVISAFVAGAAALGLAALLLWKNRWSSFNRSVASALAAAGLIQIGNGLGLMDASHVLFWRRLALLGELAQPVTLLYV